ncbi:MAG: hypothetical protein Fur0046_13820 [Cyanobacteria bacterium J069]
MGSAVGIAAGSSRAAGAIALGFCPVSELAGLPDSSDEQPAATNAITKPLNIP